MLDHTEVSTLPENLDFVCCQLIPKIINEGLLLMIVIKILIASIYLLFTLYHTWGYGILKLYLILTIG